LCLFKNRWLQEIPLLTFATYSRLMNKVVFGKFFRGPQFWSFYPTSGKITRPKCLPQPQSSRITRSLSNKGTTAHIIPIAGRDFVNPAVSLRKKRTVKTHVLSLSGNVSQRLLATVLTKGFFRSLHICRITFVGSGIAALFLRADFFYATPLGFFYR
jgi:hypothetical protein